MTSPRGSGARRLLSSVPFASYLAYSPRGTSDISRRSRQLVPAIKTWNPDIARSLIERLATDEAAAAVREFLTSETTLVPVPRSAPLVPGGLWPPRLICDQLVEIGLGAVVVTCLRRTKAVAKSASANPGARPTVQEHFDSIAAKGDLLVGNRVTIVDDFITKGATLLAAASRFIDAYPRVDLRVFGLVRTMGLVPDIDAIVAPVVGEVTVDLFGEADRHP